MILNPEGQLDYLLVDAINPIQSQPAAGIELG